MEETFQISDPKRETAGDYISFTVSDCGQKIPATISRTALVVLAQGESLDDIMIFETHRERIRKAAYEMRRTNPTLDVLMLGSLNF
jgi:hypothetical protein